jgi:hypothetical protein
MRENEVGGGGGEREIGRWRTGAGEEPKVTQIYIIK